jgi:hypothetical protein
MSLKKLFEQRRENHNEYIERKEEYDNFINFSKNTDLEIFDMMKKKLPKLKTRAINILADLYPQINFDFVNDERGMIEIEILDIHQNEIEKDLQIDIFSNNERHYLSDKKFVIQAWSNTLFFNGLEVYHCNKNINLKLKKLYKIVENITRVYELPGNQKK